MFIHVDSTIDGDNSRVYYTVGTRTESEYSYHITHCITFPDTTKKNNAASRINQYYLMLAYNPQHENTISTRRAIENVHLQQIGV